MHRHTSLRRRTYNLSNGISQIMQQMVNDEHSTKEEQVLQEAVSLTSTHSLTNRQTFEMKKISELVDYLSKNKVNLKDKLSFIFQDQLYTNLLEIYCKSQYCYEALVLYTLVTSYTNEYKDSQFDFDFLEYIFKTFIHEDSILSVTLTKMASQNVENLLEQCRKNKTFPGVSALSTVFQELVEFFYSILSQFVSWLGEKLCNFFYFYFILFYFFILFFYFLLFFYILYFYFILFYFILFYFILFYFFFFFYLLKRRLINANKTR